MTLLAVVMLSAAQTARADDSGTFGDLSWVYVSETQTLTFSGSGSTGNFYSSTEYTRPWGSTNIKHIVFTDGVTSIGNYVFKKHTALEDVTFEGVTTLTSIGSEAFHSCSNLTSITLPEGLTTIYSEAFAYSGLASVTLPTSLNTISDYAFMRTALISVTIPAGVTAIGTNAFNNSSTVHPLSMVFMYADPTKLTIWNGAFRSGVTFHVTDIAAWEARYPYATYHWDYEDIPTNVWESGNTHVKLFADGTVRVSKKTGTDGVMADYADYTGRPWNDNRTDIQKVIVKSGVPGIGNSAFRGCSNLTSVTLPQGLTSIGNYAFCVCSNLTSVTLPEGLTSIGTHVFYQCSNLTSITLPQSLTSIGVYAFDNCTSLASVTIYAPSLTNYGVNAFNSNSSTRKIYVFNDCVDTYQTNWSAYASAIEAITVTANDAGGSWGRWGTYYNGLADVTVADGTTIYKAAVTDGDVLTLTEVEGNIVKRGEAVLLKSASSATVAIASAASSGSGDFSGNELLGCDHRTACGDLLTGGLSGGTLFVMGKKDERFGFFEYTAGYMPANRAYIALPPSASLAPARGLTIAIGGDGSGQTAIQTVGQDTATATAVYTLDGRRVKASPLRPGLYIVNGKKQIVK